MDEVLKDATPPSSLMAFTPIPDNSWCLLTRLAPRPAKGNPCFHLPLWMLPIPGRRWSLKEEVTVTRADVGTLVIGSEQVTGEHVQEGFFLSLPRAAP